MGVAQIKEQSQKTTQNKQSWLRITDAKSEVWADNFRDAKLNAGRFKPKEQLNIP